MSLPGGVDKLAGRVDHLAQRVGHLSKQLAQETAATRLARWASRHPPQVNFVRQIGDGNTGSVHEVSRVHQPSERVAVKRVAWSTQEQRQSVAKVRARGWLQRWQRGSALCWQCVRAMHAARTAAARTRTPCVHPRCVRRAAPAFHRAARRDGDIRAAGPAAPAAAHAAPGVHHGGGAVHGDDGEGLCAHTRRAAACGLPARRFAHPSLGCPQAPCPAAAWQLRAAVAASCSCAAEARCGMRARRLAAGCSSTW
jgi:hypothetical protein